MIYDLRMQCEGEFAAKAQWTTFVSVPVKEFCTCLSTRQFDDVTLEQAKKITTPNYTFPDEERYKVQSIVRICAGIAK